MYDQITHVGLPIYITAFCARLQNAFLGTNSDTTEVQRTFAGAFTFGFYRYNYSLSLKHNSLYISTKDRKLTRNKKHIISN